MKTTSTKPALVAIAALVLSGLPAIAAASTDVTLVEPKKFNDYLVSGKNQDRSVESLQRDFSNLFGDLSDKLLGEDVQLEVKITDVDLAGNMKFSAGPTVRDIRIVDHQDPYRVEFNYVLKDSSGVVKSEGEAEIKSFLRKLPSRYRHDKYHSINYMYVDVKKWMEQNLSN